MLPASRVISCPAAQPRPLVPATSAAAGTSLEPSLPPHAAPGSMQAALGSTHAPLGTMRCAPRAALRANDAAWRRMRPRQVAPLSADLPSASQGGSAAHHDAAGQLPPPVRLSFRDPWLSAAPSPDLSGNLHRQQQQRQQEQRQQQPQPQQQQQEQVLSQMPIDGPHRGFLELLEFEERSAAFASAAQSASGSSRIMQPGTPAADALCTTNAQSVARLRAAMRLCPSDASFSSSSFLSGRFTAGGTSAGAQQQDGQLSLSLSSLQLPPLASDHQVSVDLVLCGRVGNACSATQPRSVLHHTRTVSGAPLQLQLHPKRRQWRQLQSARRFSSSGDADHDRERSLQLRKVRARARWQQEAAFAALLRHHAVHGGDAGRVQPEAATASCEVPEVCASRLVAEGCIDYGVAQVCEGLESCGGYDMLQVCGAGLSVERCSGSLIRLTSVDDEDDC